MLHRWEVVAAWLIVLVVVLLAVWFFIDPEWFLTTW